MPSVFEHSLHFPTKKYDYVHMCVACDVYLCVCVRDRGREKREKGERNFIYHLFNRLIERCEENEHSSAGRS